MQRVCFRLRVKPGRVEEYVERHREVWPEMKEALRQAGWRNYSLFISPDGELTGYLECEDFTSAVESMNLLEVNRRWQEQMEGFFEAGGAPDRQMRPLEEVFHLD